ncbi:MAG: cadherin-like beta sandwich domain-containing protein [Breznakibacter sp.]
MEKKNLLLSLWGLISLAVLFGSVAKAQTIDATGVFDPKLTGEADVVYAALVYNDLGIVGTMDAGFCLVGKADGSQITAYTDYNASIAFYSAGVQARQGTTGFVADNVIPTVSGRLYHVWFVLNNPAMTYKVYAVTDGIPIPTLISNSDLGYRNGSSTEVNRWSAFHASEADVVTVHYCGTVGAVGEYPPSIIESLNDYTLKSMVPSIGTLSPEFDPTITEYELTVPYGTESVSFTAVANGAGASVSGNTGILLEEGYAYVNIEVLSASGDKGEYAVNITSAAGETDATLSGLTVNGLIESVAVNWQLKPAFNRFVTEYDVFVSKGTTKVNVAATPMYNGATVTGTGNNIILDENGSKVVTVTVKSADNTTTTTYKLNITTNLIKFWDGNGATGTGSSPDAFGWEGTTVTGWGEANGGGIRYIDVISSNAWTYNGVKDWTGRVLYVRWDGVGGAGTSNVYSYPVELEACKSYVFSGKFGWPNNASSAKYTIGINSAKDNTGTSLTSTEFVPAVKSTVLYDVAFIFTAPENGTYYLTIANAYGILGAAADLSIVENVDPTINFSKSSITLFDYAPTTSLFLTGNALSGDIVLSAPAGITLTPSTITKEAAQCGVNVQVEYDSATKITNGTITATSGSLTQTVTVNARPIIVNGVVDGTFENAEADAAPYGEWINDLDKTLGGATTSRVMNNNGYQSNGSKCFYLRFLDDGTSYNSISTKVYSLTEGATYRFYFNYKSNSTDETALVNVYAATSANDAETAISPVFTSVPVTDATTEQPLNAGEIEFVAPSTEVWIVFEKQIPTTYFNFFIDDLMLTPNASTLSDLTVDDETIAGFAPAKLTYDVVLPAGTTDIPQVNGVLLEAGSSLVVTQATGLPGTATLLVTGQDGTSNTYTVNFTVEGTATSVKPNKGTAVVVYPTVSKGSFTVKTDGQAGSITVFDITGKVIGRQTAIGTEQTVSIARAGIYILKVETAAGTKMVKVIVTR